MSDLLTSLRLTLVLTLLLGFAYTYTITGVAQLFFSSQANGSLIAQSGKSVGSELIAQKFSRSEYFWPRPSAIDFNTLNSGGSNLGPTSTALKQAFKERVQAFSEAAPQDLLFTSASGLDPDISIAAAEFQVERVARARGVETNAIRLIVRRSATLNQFGFLGQPRVNVLKLNLSLNDIGHVHE